MNAPATPPVITLASGRRIGPGCPCFVVAEVGNNHQGDMAHARRMVEEAAKAGVQAVKFQKRHMESLLTRAGREAPYTGANSFGPTYGAHRNALELSIEQMAELKALTESLGMVFLEAQSCGLPVVAFADGGIPEVVEQGATGYLTPVHDPAAYAAAVERLLADEPRREKMGRAAAKRVRERHDLNRNYLQVETRLAEILRDHRRRRAMGDGMPGRAPADS